MPGLFEQFPHTNLHELNLDWMIDLLNTFKDELENRAVLSVNGMTGEVTLYESENVVLPPLTDVSSWRLVRMMDGQYVGVLFQDGHVWLQQGNSTLKLLTTEDIPTSAGVVSINGLGGIVRLTGADIPIDNSADPDSVRLALENERTARQNADASIRQDLTALQDNAVLKNEIHYNAGDSISYTAYAIGYVTSNGTKLTIPIELPRTITYGITPVLQSGTRMEIRGVTGYIGGFNSGNSIEIVDNPNYTISLYRIEEGFIAELNITLTSGTFDVTNNTPIIVKFTPLKINFT